MLSNNVRFNVSHNGASDPEDLGRQTANTSDGNATTTEVPQRKGALRRTGEAHRARGLALPNPLEPSGGKDK